MKTINIKLNGISPMLMHSDRASDPLSTDAQWLSEIAKKRQKSEDDIMELARREWHCSMYRSGGRPVMPIDNLHACIYAAAKRRKEGPVFAGNTIVEKCSLLVLDAPEGDWNFETLWEISQDPEDERSWVDRRSVRVGTSRVQRTRAVFRAWAVEATVLFEDSPVTGKASVDIGHLEVWLKIAGANIGLGDFRPQKGGVFGRFEHEFMD